MASTDACLILEDVGMTYRSRARDGIAAEVPAIRSVSQRINKGEFVTIIGPSGCGKTTLFEIIGGLKRPSSGEIYIHNQRITSPHPSISMVFQEESIFPWRTVIENVEFGLELKNEDKKTRREKSQRVIELVGLQGFENRHPRELSGGMKQRVAIARALALDPEILLMDEPFGALDQQTRLILGGELLRIWERTKKTILFVTHDISESILLSDRVWVMSHRPSVIKEIVEIDIPRPRDTSTVTLKRFNELSNHLWELLRPESEKALGLLVYAKRSGADSIQAPLEV